MTLAEAVEELRDRVEADMIPALADGDLQAILQRCVTVRVFAASTPFQQGEVVVPSTANLDTYTGASYLVTGGGVSGSEPSWPSGPGVPCISGYITLSYLGPYSGPYDMSEAERLGWKRKMGAAARLVSSASKGQKFERQQVFEHCKSRLEACGPSWRGY